MSQIRDLATCKEISLLVAICTAASFDCDVFHEAQCLIDVALYHRRETILPELLFLVSLVALILTMDRISNDDVLLEILHVLRGLML